jgi:hypothetical protein
MNVAASTGAANIIGYMIPIGRLLRVADAVRAGDERGVTVVGYDAFLGIELDTRVTDVARGRRTQKPGRGRPRRGR